MTRSDLGNAEQFAKIADGRLVYSKELGWFEWNGRIWTPEENVLREVIHRTIEVLHATSQDERDHLHAFNTEDSRRIKAMVDLAKTHPVLLRKTEDFDKEQFIINTQNGILDLQTMSLSPHAKYPLCTKICNANYDPSSRSSLWEKFIDDITLGKTELARFLQKAAGYSATASNSEQVMFILYGDGANGKSTFIEAIRHTLGNYAKATDSSTLMMQRSGSIRNDIARLRGSRFVSAVEAGSKGKLDEVMVKQLTGNDTIIARYLHREFFEFTPTWKIHLATNHRPEMDGVDYAIWRRIRLVPFEATFMKPDKYMLDKLRVHADAILKWVVDGYVKWTSEGLKPPQEVTDATEKYREDMDVIGSFLDEVCYKHPEATVPISDLYDKYLRWARVNNEKALSKNTFGTSILRKQRGIKAERNKYTRYWVGVGLKHGVVLGDLCEQEEKPGDTVSENS